MFVLIEMTNVLTNIYVPHGMSTMTKITNVIKKLIYNYVIKVIKVTKTLTYNYVPHDMSDVIHMINVTKELSYNCAT
jgi:hypothetical protein